MFKKLFFIMFFVFSCNQAFATVIQRFYGTNYTNPAAMNEVHTSKFNAGLFATNFGATYSGNVFNDQGSASTDFNEIFPYFLVEQRVTPKLVLGMNFSQPYNGTWDFAPDSLVAPVGYATTARDIDINPMFSYQLTKRLAVGAGLIAHDMYLIEFDFMAPGGTSVNKVGSWIFGWNAGLSFMATPTTILKAAYFSKLDTTFTGTSVYQNQVDHDAKLNGLTLPATLVLEGVHFFNEKWLASLRLYWSKWNDTKVVRMQGLPFNINFPVYYQNSVAAGLYNRYQIDCKWAVSGLIAFENKAGTGGGATILYPASTFYYLQAGVDYQLTKEFNARLSYGYGWSNVAIRQMLGLDINGSERLRFHGVDIGLIYNL